MKLKKKTRQKIKEKRIGSRDKKNCKKKQCDIKMGRATLNFLLPEDSLKINPVWSSSLYGLGRI